MKTKILLTALLSFYFCLLSSQVPQGFNYQAIARDGSGNPITNTSLQVRLTIQADSAGSNVIWQELHSSVTTNSFGLFTLVVGRGERQSGSALTFDAIDWSVTPEFIKTEVNYGGWKDMGTTRFWSVPYAMHSKGSDAWQTNGANVFKATGNVGIETVNPITFLDVKTSSDFHFGAFNGTAGAVSIGAFNDGFTAWQPLSINPGGQVWFGGNVGIGNTNPGFILDVSGRARIRAAGESTGIWFNNQANSLLRGFIGMYNDDLMGFCGPAYVWGLTMNVTNGYVGVNTTAPAYPLHVVGTTKIDGNLYIDNNLNAGGYGGVGNLNGYNIEIGGDSPTATNGQATIYLHHHSAIAHQLRYTAGVLYLEAAGNGYGTNTTPALQIGGPLYAAVNGGNVGIGTASPAKKLHIHNTVEDAHLYISSAAPSIELGNNVTFGSSTMYGLFALATAAANYGVNAGDVILGAYGNSHGNIYITSNYSGTGTTNIIMQPTAGNVGIGTKTPTSKVVIQPPAGWDDNTPLFDVKNAAGVSVFTIYNNGIRAFVQTNSGKGVKGGFAIGGFDPTKAGNVNLMSISPDSIRFYINNGTTKATTKGGFAIGSFDNSKANNQDFMYVTPQSSGNGQYNTFLGYQAGISNTTGSDNVFIGYMAANLNSTGLDNVIIGKNAAASGNVSHSTFVGSGAGLVTTASYNTFLGCYAGNQTTSGQNNTYVGTYSGFTNPTGNYNTFIGMNAGEAANGSGNVLIGYQAGQNLTGNNQLFIDNGPTATPLIWGDFSGNKLIINGNSSNNPLGYTFYVNGNAGGNSGWNILSDSRFKKDIIDIDNPLEKLVQLRGVYFNWIDTARSNKQQLGFIAQEAEKIIPQVVNKSNGYYSMDYAPITALLVEGMKQQQKLIENQQSQINSQNEKIDHLEKVVEEMQSAMQRSGIK